MIHLIYGKDRYLVRRALHDLRDELARNDDMLDTNTSVLDGASLTPGELLANAQAVPFLAQSRLVIVEGLLGQIGGGRRARKAKKYADDDPLAPWAAAAAQLGDPAQMPATTTLVFVEGELAKSNAAFAMFAPISRVVAYDGLDKDALIGWIQGAAKARGVAFEGRALPAFAQLTSGDLWTIENELDKLAAYGQDGKVDEKTVEDVVSSAQEAKVWDLSDAIVAGNERKALAVMRTLLEAGQAAPLLMFMIVRQYRQIIMLKDMREHRARPDEIARATSILPFRMGAVGALASRYAWDDLRAAYALLLDADLSVKRGLRDDESALQLAVHELCRLAPPGRGAAPPASARSR